MNNRHDPDSEENQRMMRENNSYAGGLRLQALHEKAFQIHEVLGARKDLDKWRKTKPLVGEINGFPQSHGILRATNGILCIIEVGSTAQPTFFEGHLGWFKTHNPLYQSEVTELLDPSTKPLTSKAEQAQDIMKALMDLI